MTNEATDEVLVLPVSDKISQYEELVELHNSETERFIVESFGLTLKQMIDKCDLNAPLPNDSLWLNGVRVKGEEI